MRSNCVRLRVSWVLAMVVPLAACGGRERDHALDLDGGTRGSGGESGTGGTAATASGGIDGKHGSSKGGGTSTGGTTETGGVTSTGGTTETGGVTSTGGTTETGGVTSTGGTPTIDPSDPMGAFFAVWKASQSEIEPGSFTPRADAAASCFRCVSASGCTTPQSDSCLPGSACVYRHCLCKPDAPAGGQKCVATDYPTNVSTCIDSCFMPGTPCVGGWIDYGACVAAACSSSCGG